MQIGGLCGSRPISDLASRNIANVKASYSSLEMQTS